MKKRVSPDISQTSYDIIKASAVAQDRSVNWLIAKILNDWADSQSKPKKAPKKVKAVAVVDEAISAFEQIWEMYGKKGNRKTSLAKWSVLTRETMQLIFEHIPKYVASTPEKQFRKNFETYINQEGWNDEITERAASSGKISSYDESMQQLSTLHRESIDSTEDIGILGNDEAGLF